MNRYAFATGVGTANAPELAAPAKGEAVPGRADVNDYDLATEASTVNADVPELAAASKG